MQREADVREPVGNAGRVLAALREFGRPISAYDVLDRLRPNGVRTPTTVYRALKALIEMRLVHRLEALNAYVACAHPRHADDVCFAICTYRANGQAYLSEIGKLKRLIKPTLGFQSMETAYATIKGFEVMRNCLSG